MKLSLALALLLLTQNVFGTSRPNIIIVVTDDQGYGEFSINGNPIADTPHIDRLASQGIRFTDFHVAPMCTPTRGQLLTGLDAFRNGAINVSSGRTLLRPELPTIADIFAAADYRTGLFGKWHMGDNFPFRPEDRGFEEAIWFPSSHINSTPDYWDNDYFDDIYIHNTQRRQFHGYCTDVFFDEAMDWMQKQAEVGDNFFTFIALNSAHWPWFVPDEYRQPIRDAMTENPESVTGLSDKRREDLVSFLAMGANIDYNMGRLQQFLTDSGLEENTIVIFTTDNGSTFGPEYYNAGMQGKKTTLWEGGHRVPLFLRWPGGNIGGNRSIDELCHIQDLLPTLTEFAGIKNLPKDLDGISLAPLLRGDVTELEDRMLVINYSRMPHFKVTYTGENPAIPRKEGAAVLWKHWRLLEDRMLFDVSKDLHQDHDVAAQHPEVVAKMRAHLDEWWQGVKDTVLEPQRVIIGDDRENPMLLTACEWLDVFIDQQIQVRRGVQANGIWHLKVAQAGTYQLTLSRYPPESGLKLRDAPQEVKVTDGTFVAGPAFDIATARLQIGDHILEKSVYEDVENISFELSLSKGDTTMQTWFIDPRGEDIVGAYYVITERM